MTGRPYRFYVVSLNHVGQSNPSDILSVYSCDYPSGLEAPEKLSITQTSVTVTWMQPANDGGCPITSYALYRDGGPSEDQFTEIHPAEVNNNPALNQFTITDLPAGILGEKLRIKVKVSNLAGLSHSSEQVLVVIVCDKPSAPTSGPISVASQTTTNFISVTYSEPTTGGSPITNFELQMDDGIGGGFETVAGGELALYKRMSVRVQTLPISVPLNSYDSDSDSFAKQIVRGRPYRFRYRAKNYNGWSDYSPVSTIYAASRPQSPQPVTLLSSDSTQL